MSDYQKRPSHYVGSASRKSDEAALIETARSAAGPTPQDFLFSEKVAAKPLAAPLTLPTDSAERKEYPMMSGCLKYFPAALAGVAKTSKLGNDKHNPGQPLHHARGKSTDHGDCIIRHLTDTEDLLAALRRNQDATPDQVLQEVNQLAWRALAYSQELHERFGSPMAPGAELFETTKGE